VNSQDIFADMAEYSASGIPFAQVSVIGSRGPHPRAAGACMLVLRDGGTRGTIGGGVLEKRATEDAVRCLQDGESRVETYSLTESGDRALGARCGGEVRVFFSVQQPAESLVIIGAGHIGQQLCALAGLLGYRITVIDSRPDMVTSERFPAADLLLCSRESWTPESCPITSTTSVVIVTHAAELDRDALRAIVPTEAGYVGMMGSKRKVASIFQELEAEGIRREALDRVHAPIGLRIGAETPGELALCILAEMVAAKSARNAQAPAPDDPRDGGGAQDA